jgi:hypothetical protein
MKFIVPIILLGISITVFVVFTNPIYNDIGTLGVSVASYNEALNNSKSLENQRDKLTAKYNTINPDDLTKLQKLLPENVDNIRLILEIEKIASPYNMILTDVKYNATATAPTAAVAAPATASVQTGAPTAIPVQNYGVFDLEFSTAGSYNNFIAFTKDIESNLRIVDISSINFSSDTTSAISTTKTLSPIESYKYDFKIRTYWLKN